MAHRADRPALSLQQLENSARADPPTGATRLIETVHRLRRKPIALLTAEDVRLLLGQRVGVPFLVPRALAMLEQDPLREGDLYPGDLLASTLRVPPSHWQTHHDHLDRLERILSTLDPTAENVDLLRKPIASFRAQLRP
ncbi:contact-dependent growth inhibition system immunity protein [Amycolatopsis sp. WGS_07]|uniref:contact-dependent growth inhibition system immunity protein n=1 Tax=Amycolatopsis sp. WGS_07 TaxID=3076764 RepID=UPI003873C7AF